MSEMINLNNFCHYCKNVLTQNEIISHSECHSAFESFQKEQKQCFHLEGFFTSDGTDSYCRLCGHAQFTKFELLQKDISFIKSSVYLIIASIKNKKLQFNLDGLIVPLSRLVNAITRENELDIKEYMIAILSNIDFCYNNDNIFNTTLEKDFITQLQFKVREIFCRYDESFIVLYIF